MEIKSRVQLVDRHPTLKKHYKNLSLSNIREYYSGIGWVNEKWRCIKGYEGYYSVSTFGRVKSHPRLVYRGRDGVYCKRPERILRQKIHRDGYLCVSLQVDKKRNMYQVHILTCSAFIKNKHNKIQVNHKFGNKKDNRASKLEWLTPKENTQHAIKLGIAPSQIGETNNRSKLTEKDVISIREKSKNGFTGVFLAKLYNVHPTAINKIVTKKTWSYLQ